MRLNIKYFTIKMAFPNPMMIKVRDGLSFAERPGRSVAFGIPLTLLFFSTTLKALEDPGLSGGTAFAEWDVFTESSGGANLPDVVIGGSTGFSLDPVLRQTDPTSGAFITSSGNIYSFIGVTSFTIEGSFGGDLRNLVLQFTTFGNEIDYDSIRFSFGPSFSSFLTPTTAVPTFNSAGEVDFLAQWDLSGLGLLNDPFRISFTAVGTSSSLAAARIDASDTFNDVAPTAPIIETTGESLAYAGEAVSIQIEATGEPFVYSGVGLPSWLSLDNATGLISGTVPAGSSGPVSFTVTAFNGQSSNPVTINLLTVIPQTYAEWVLAEALTIGESAETDDPDGDDRNNLEEYFHGTDPLEADFGPAALSLRTEPGQPDRLVWSFDWNIRAAEVTAVLETAGSDFNWIRDAPGAELRFSPDGRAEASLVTEASNSGFIRLVLSR